MKRKISYLAALLALALVISLSVSTFAATTKTSVEQGRVNLSILRQTKIGAAETFIGSNGAKIPATLTYKDEKGGSTTYVSLRVLADLLNAEIYWDGATQTVHFGEGDGDDETTISTGTSEKDLLTDLPNKPELDNKQGIFTEIAPLPETEKGRAVAYLDDAEIRSSTGFSQQLYLFGEYGNYVEIEITNHGAPISIQVANPSYVSSNWAGGENAFTEIKLETGKSIVRAFSMEDIDDVTRNNLWLNVDTKDTKTTTDITISVKQYLLVD